MQPVYQPLAHLSQLLRDHVPFSSSRPPAQDAIDDFFRSIASERIRFDRGDWQGRPVTALLWHMPNLKPHRQVALVAYITHRWDNYAAGAMVFPVGAEPPADSPAETCQAPAGESASQREMKARRESGGSPAIHLSTVTAPRRDWFDRFTDWVAAVVSLFA